MSILQNSQKSSDLVGYSAADLGWDKLPPRGSLEGTFSAKVSSTTVKNSKRTDPYYKMFGANYCPLVMEVAQHMDLYAAAVLGRIASYCQMKDNKCYASQGTLAKELHISQRTVVRIIKKLLDAGLIEVDPNWQNGTSHVYRPAQNIKAALAKLGDNQ